MSDNPTKIENIPSSEQEIERINNERAWVELINKKEPRITEILEFLRGKTSDRKMRLFAVSCILRSGRGNLKNYEKELVDDVERLADGLIQEGEMIVPDDRRGREDWADY